MLGRDTPWLAGAKPLLTQQGTVHSNYPQRAEDAFWGEPQATAVTVGAQGGQGQARNLGVRSSVYEDGLRARQMVGGQGIDARPHWHAATKSPNRGLHTNKAHVAVSMHSQMQPSAPNAQSTPQLLVVPQERAQKDSVGRDTPAIRALQSQLSSTQRAVEGTTHGIWRSTEPASATFQKLNTLSGPDEPTPLQSMAPLDTLEASAEHVPSRANRQRGRAPRKAVRMSAQGGTPEQVDLVSGHAAVSESSFPLGPGALKGWLGYSDGTGVPGTESHREFQEDDWEEKPLGEQGLGETAEGEAVDRYPLGRFSRASAKFDQALGFENVDEFGHELSEGKKRSRDEAESEAERATYLSNVEGRATSLFSLC